MIYNGELISGNFMLNDLVDALSSLASTNIILNPTNLAKISSQGVGARPHICTLEHHLKTILC